MVVVGRVVVVVGIVGRRVVVGRVVVVMVGRGVVVGRVVVVVVVVVVVGREVVVGRIVVVVGRGIELELESSVILLIFLKKFHLCLDILITSDSLKPVGMVGRGVVVVVVGVEEFLFEKFQLGFGDLTTSDSLKPVWLEGTIIDHVEAIRTVNKLKINKTLLLKVKWIK